MAITRSKVYEITNVNLKNPNDPVNYVITEQEDSHVNQLPASIEKIYNVYLKDIPTEE